MSTLKKKKKKKKKRTMPEVSKKPSKCFWHMAMFRIEMDKRKSLENWLKLLKDITAISVLL